MKFPARRIVLAFVALSAASLARAHPGQDDGHELTWELGHLAAHPAATLACAAVVVVAAWAGWKLVQGATAARRKRDAQGR
jgi:hypothetical protein